MRGRRYGQRDHHRARLKHLRRLLLLAALLFVAGVVVYAPRTTELSTLLLRGSGGLVAAILLVGIVRRSARSFAAPPAPVPESVDAREADVAYQCRQCGTRLRLEVASTGKAPRHCGEEMDAIVG